jgi:glycosyltransferase involved in cell wall biosynthesis
VAFRVGGIAEVVEDGVTGRLVPFGDVPALAAAVCDLLQRPEQAARMGAAGRTKAAREFNAADQCRQIESLIRTMLARS